MDLSSALYVTAVVMVVVFAAIVIFTRRMLRTPPGSRAEAEALAALATELKRANDLAAERVETLEARVARLERGAE